MSDGINARVIQFAQRQIGHRVGRGECYDLAHQALRASGARSAPDYGEITDDADYVWGESVELSDVRAGDVIQFRDYSFRITRDDGSWSEEERPHHTAIVASVGENGAIEVYEQNVPQGHRVRRSQLYFADSTGGAINVRVSGSFWFYRPQART